MSADDRDEFDHVFSGHFARESTKVGLGAVESRRESVTPSSGIPALLAGADVTVILRRISDVEREVKRLADSGLVERERLDKIRAELRALRLYANRIAKGGEAHAGELGRVTKALSDLAGFVGALAGDVGEVRKTLGKPPQKLDERVSQQGQATAEQLAEVEAGTGVAGSLGRLVARVHRLEIRVTAGAVLGSAITQITFELMKSGYGGAVAIGAAALSLSGAGAVFVRRRKEKKS